MSSVRHVKMFRKNATYNFWVPDAQEVILIHNTMRIFECHTSAAFAWGVLYLHIHLCGCLPTWIKRMMEENHKKCEFDQLIKEMTWYDHYTTQVNSIT
jgi:hypothetical protein